MLIRIVSAILFAAAASTAALADDRPPTPEERTAITTALEAAGFTSWEEIELDDGVWEIDDAIHTDGQKYDLKLAPESLEIIEQERD